MVVLLKGRFFISLKGGAQAPFFHFKPDNEKKSIFIYKRKIMLYLTKNEPNTLVLNINNNSRDTFDTYTLVFNHIMSSLKKTYVIDLADPLQYTANQRYCSIYLPLDEDDLNYLGQYQLKIYGDSTNLVFTSMAELIGPQESPLFREYQSPNEDNENYIYIQD